MRTGKLVFSLLLVIAGCGPGFLAAQSAAVSMEDFSFLAGYWSGTGFGGRSEEMWMPPGQGRMFGVYKQSSSEGELQFTEYMEILNSEGEFLLRLKHFSPDFSGWETAEDFVTFPLVRVEDKRVVFDGLVYELNEAGQLRVSVTLEQDDGSFHTEVVQLTRKSL